MAETKDTENKPLRELRICLYSMGVNVVEIDDTQGNVTTCCPVIGASTMRVRFDASKMTIRTNYDIPASNSKHAQLNNVMYWAYHYLDEISVDVQHQGEDRARSERFWATLVDCELKYGSVYEATFNISQFPNHHLHLSNPMPAEIDDDASVEFIWNELGVHDETDREEILAILRTWAHPKPYIFFGKSVDGGSIVHGDLIRRRCKYTGGDGSKVFICVDDEFIEINPQWIVRLSKQ